MNNNTILIDRYLQNELPAEERVTFEKQLENDVVLKEEITIQQKIINSIESIAVKQEFSKALRKQWILQQVLKWGLIILIVAAISFIHHHFKNHF